MDAVEQYMLLTLYIIRLDSINLQVAKLYLPNEGSLAEAVCYNHCKKEEGNYTGSEAHITTCNVLEVHWNVGSIMILS